MRRKREDKREERERAKKKEEREGRKRGKHAYKNYLKMKSNVFT